MRLTHLTLQQYRNHTSVDVDFDPERPLQYLIGPNAHGKTNILEAIYLLALTKSFRTSTQEDLIQWDQEYARVKATLQTNRDTFELEIFLGNPPQPKRQLKKNGVKISAEDFIGNCQIVFFHPEDLNILYLGPDLRRRYLDVMNIQLFKPYFRALKNYRRIHQQRNALLKNIKDGLAGIQDLEIWDEQLIEHGALITAYRRYTLSFINKHLQEEYQSIAQKNEAASVKYVSNIWQNQYAPLPDNLSLPNESDLEEIKALFTESLCRARQKDLYSLHTSVGPHRDDMELTLKDRPIASHASRGEVRSLLLALKLLELTYHEHHTQEKPLLLLDDVFSELDEDRQKMLMQTAEKGGHQTIITTTHLDQNTTTPPYFNTELRQPNPPLNEDPSSAAQSTNELQGIADHLARPHQKLNILDITKQAPKALRY
jgi:DNA replication and repair protein RecF